MTANKPDAMASASSPTTQWLAIALIFTTYNLQFFAVMAFLPIFLMQRIGLTLAMAPPCAIKNETRVNDKTTSTPLVWY